jgi:hypothetical protein
MVVKRNHLISASDGLIAAITRKMTEMQYKKMKEGIQGTIGLP